MPFKIPLALVKLNDQSNINLIPSGEIIIDKSLNEKLTFLIERMT